MKTILITGCSSGIGEAAAKDFHSRGYRVLATVRRGEDRARLESLGIDTVGLELADAHSVAAAVTEALTRSNGRIDAVIHNAGVGVYGALEDLPREAIEQQFQSNVFGVHQINTLMIPHMRAAGGGRIVIVTSVLGVVSAPFRGLYVASKFALEGLADTLRLELAGSGIDVSLVEPGPIETAFRRNALAALRRYIDPEQSVHRERYGRFVASLAGAQSPSRFALPAEACLPSLRHAVEATSPCIRYRVTVPARYLPILKRMLPARWLDRILMKG